MFPTRAMTILGGDEFRDEYSLAFDGSNDFIDFGDTNDLGTGDFSITAWIKAADYADFYILSKYQTSGIRWYFAINSSDKVTFYGNPASGTTLSMSGTGALTGAHLNNWVHVTFSCDRDGNMRTFINGVFDKTASGSAIDLDNSASLVTACRNDGSSHVTGSISEITMYNIALSDSQVATIYNDREPYNHKEGVASGNLTSWWRMGDGVLDRFNLVGDETNATIGDEQILDDKNETGFASTDWAVYNIAGGNLTVVSSKLQVVTETDEANEGVQLDNSKLTTPVVGKIYRISAELQQTAGATTPTMYFDYAGTASESFTITGDSVIYTKYILATNAGSDLFIYNAASASATTFKIDNVSVKIVNGTPGVMLNMDAADFEGDTP